ncbi:phosphomannomutase [Thiosulfativibrio zosterae]|uniref:Phosphomannomutase n=1 Tax=Thiosulfativibrio zosterae TaxID=2675053 RepID=A0A6F8PQV9_9GAMM|nr:phosphomannomutase [Thiosulfativibrio zosterae]BBP44499.1 phosphomannomutase [Thiosulfativibrio zosterae]
MKLSHNVIKNSGIEFGTSGARGLVEQFTNEVCAAFTLAFLSTLKGRFEVKSVCIGIDRRPSSPQIAAACCSAAATFGVEVEYCGVLPTPALAYKAMQNNQAAIMITGSHIPFDRNGIKFYRPDGEISKTDEHLILSAEQVIPTIDYAALPLIKNEAVNIYLERYLKLVPLDFLHGKRVGIYEHSSAGRALYVDLFTQLGAEVISLGRSEEFVPIDTEAVSQKDVEQGIVWANEFQLDFLFSTDGDGDRPLIADEHGQWLRGDIVGLLSAQYIGIKALAVPVSCNSAIEKSGLFEVVIRTKIGSPYVIEYMENLIHANQTAVAGFEANGGFLLGSDLTINHQSLKALPTRDALLPVIALIALSIESQKPLSVLVDALPCRYTASDRIQNFAKEKSQRLIAEWTKNPEAALAFFALQTHHIQSIDTTDGLRITLDNDDIVHFRPSGNAPELRCYAEAASYKAAQALVFNCLKRISEF